MTASGGRGVWSLRAMKARGERIAALTAYDFVTASILERAGVDFLLVGDSMEMVLMGRNTTLSADLDLLVAHCRAVSAGAPGTLVVADMPFGSYQGSDEAAVGSAVRFLAEGGADAVKLEGGNGRMLSRVRAITDSGIPVMGHTGLQPQSVRMTGGYRVVRSDQRDRLLGESMELQEAGVFALVLESVEEGLAAEVSSMLSIPVIGIGAGRRTDGQILVVNDMLGLSGDFHPRFLKVYERLGERILEAVGNYVREVREGDYPSEEHVYGASEGNR